MLLKVHEKPYKAGSDKLLQNMVVSKFNQMVLFTQSLQLSLSQASNAPNIAVKDEGDFDSILVRFHPHGATHEQLSSPDPAKDVRELTIPLTPDIDGLETIPIDLYTSTTRAYDMGSYFNDWFSACFGFRVKFIYLGPNLRPVLGNIGLPPSPPETPTNTSSLPSWLPSMTNITTSLPLIGSWLSLPSPKSTTDASQSVALPSTSQITFADCAAYLITTTESLSDVSARLPEGEVFDITKFRPNVVLSGSPGAWDEDFWGTISISPSRSSKGSSPVPNGTHTQNPVNNHDQEEGIHIVLTANCSRCISINIDYATGAPGKGAAGTMLKKLMNNRRVDAGRKWSPIFGRYGFLAPESRGSSASGGDDGDEWRVVSVGDRVEVVSRLEARKTWCECFVSVLVAHCSFFAFSFSFFLFLFLRVHIS